MRRILLVFAVGAVMSAMLGFSASPALADDRDHHKDHHQDRFRDVDFVVLDFDDEDDDFFDRGRFDFFVLNRDEEEDENDWACVDDFGNALFFVEGPTDCPEGTRADLILGANDENDNDHDLGDLRRFDRFGDRFGDRFNDRFLVF